MPPLRVPTGGGVAARLATALLAGCLALAASAPTISRPERGRELNIFSHILPDDMDCVGPEEQTTRIDFESATQVASNLGNQSGRCLDICYPRCKNQTDRLGLYV